MTSIFIAVTSLILMSFIIPHKEASFINKSIYDFKVDGLSGGTIDFSQFKGKKILIVTVPNSPATIDPGYRGEIRVILLNLGREPYEIHPGDRIAQMVVARYEAIEWEEGELNESRRGEGGFGSSGR